MRILVIEDEQRLAEALTQILREQKYEVDTVYDGEEGYHYARSGVYDGIIIDVMLPKRSGFEVIEELRKEKVSTPVLVLSARDEIAYKIQGLDLGADDYVTKPFVPEELLARLRTISRRVGEVVTNEVSFGDIHLDLSNNTLVCGIKSVHLGFKEFEIMKLFLTQPKRILSKEELITQVWGYDSEVEANNVEAYVSFLRKKLFFLASEVTIHSIRKVGYRLECKEL